MKIAKNSISLRLVAAIIVLATGMYGILSTAKKADAAPEDDFVITVDTAQPGTSTNMQFTIPATGAGYNYSVDCDNDGVIDATGLTGRYTCNYGAAGVYTLRISGAFPRFYFNNGDDKLKLLSIDQWGTGQWTSMAQAFYGAANMDIRATDVPDLSHVTSMSNMFMGAHNLRGENANWNWNTSNVQFMSHVFYDARLFNQDISSWNTADVRVMRSMFDQAHAFNQPVGRWNVGRVEDMFGMFAYARNFNQPLNDWNTQNVRNTRLMFTNAIAFDQPLNKWNITNITNAENMFRDVKLSTPNYDATIMGWSSQAVQANVPFGGGRSNYCLSDANRTNLIANSSWTITDAGRDCSAYQIENTQHDGSTTISRETVVGAALGTLSSNDTTASATALDTFTFAIIPGANSDFFTLDNRVIRLARPLNTLAGSQLRVMIRTTNAAGNTLDREFIFNVTNAASLPTIPGVTGQGSASSYGSGVGLAATGENIILIIIGGVLAIIGAAILITKRIKRQA